MSKIFLIGYMGVGKTTVGKVLSEKLNCDFIDPDDKEHWIRRGFPNGRSDAWHVSKEKFYDIETEILKKDIKELEAKVLELEHELYYERRNKRISEMYSEKE